MKQYVIEPERQTEIALSCDVLVAGAGIAGMAAAIAAARNGARVILLEREYGLGGMATLGLVTIYLPLCDGQGEQLVFGLGEELLKLSIAHGAEAAYPKAWLENGTLEERIQNRYITQFNPHLFALRAEQVMTALGITILYGSTAVGVVRDGSKIGAVIIENKSGRTAIAVRSVIDCTGDADVCHLSGAQTVLHSKGNGLANWYYYFSEGKVSLKMFGLADIAPSQKRVPAGGGSGVVPKDTAMVESLDKGTRFSGVDGFELSRVVLAGHAKMYEDILKHREADPEYVPTQASAIPLVRMSRRLAGAYTMDESENKKHMADSIGMTGDWRKRGPAFELPFGTLYCREVPNLLAAGRDISVTDDMWDITRVIPPCAVTGQAAGTAASMSDDFPSLDVAALQKKLTDQGARLHGNW
ncbi:FAD dependent oxidoreductase [Sporobacter termitidis DSM 10068]|uniref:FAD dependent oxidoreductase n=1 Tax=Sporobacter termitidis DSM 10068 TaxID=1123282 RepID=A0A1M5UCT1_9FIRM|nr:FAD-dependent oxidoreductase [Sporobacter termitidis]SHH60721.1 FAD dependent oxidoreductase [Sporobacter termitidis DSM 10068]